MKKVQLGQSQTPKKTRIYAIGDVHGYLDLLQNIYSKIEADLAESPVENHKIIFLGDYIDRGPDSKGCLNEFIRLKAENPNIICLRGNHEEKLLEFLDDPTEVAYSFLTYGGAECAISYGIDPVSLSVSNADMIAFRNKLQIAVPENHIQFIKDTQFSYTSGDYFFAHAGIRPDVAIEKQSENDLMKIRSEFIRHDGLFEKVIVHGHTPAYPMEILPNRINVDTCAYDTGILSCIILECLNHRIITA